MVRVKKNEKANHLRKRSMIAYNYRKNGRRRRRSEDEKEGPV
jgi:hypothetical protein